MTMTPLARFCHLLAMVSCLGRLCHAVSDDTAIGSRCCRRLSDALSSKVAYPNSAAYQVSVSSYWALQQQVISPSCVVLPTTALDVSVALGVLVPGSCRFAVRGGGHGSVTGIANIQGGVTIDMRGIDFVDPNADNSLVSIGSGQRMGNIYSFLEQRGVSIAGARAAGIGVAGSTVGGGLGFFNPSQGFACDSVAEFEVVLANASIVRATEDVNRDLWRALRGGGINFGIVTKLVFRTFPLGDAWAANVAYLPSALDGAARAFHDFTADPDYDTRAGLLMSYHYTESSPPQVVSQYIYAAPVANPPAFSGFYLIGDQIANQSSVTNVTALSAASEAASIHGLVQINFAVTFQNNIQMLKRLWKIYDASIARVSAVPGISWSLTLQPMIESLVARGNAKGGNAMGIEVPPEGLVLTLLSASFSDAADYRTVNAAADKLLADIIASAKARGLYNPFIDLNHAKASQKPFPGYGRANYKFLRATAKKYDPKGVFQRLLPEGLRL